MKILLTGANGFMGRYLLAALQRAGHDVVPAVRNVSAADRLLPEPAALHSDFNRDTTAEAWLPRLAGIDAVINCAGILREAPGQSMAAIHRDGPIALFEACRQAGVKRVIQISAISAQEDAATDYAQTKRAADEYLKTLPLEWVIVKPSLVFAPGAHGGTALFRGLAALPGVVPVVGTGDQSFRPVAMADFCALVVAALDGDTYNHRTLALVGPEEVSMREVLTGLRRWLGLSPGQIVPVPGALVRMTARLGDAIGGTINTTALTQLEFGNAGADLAKGEEIETTRTGWRAGLLAEPSQTQDRWHARLYFLRPALRWVIALTWIVSGILGLTTDFTGLSRLLASFGGGAAGVAFAAASFTDIALGVMVLTRWRPGLTAALQMGLVLAYTLALTIVLPGLWLDPFGPLLKNIAFLAAIATLAAIERDG